MDLHQEERASPFIRDIGLVPPSPELNPSSHYGSVLEFPTSPPFIDNSGSFHNSPYSGPSELSFVTADNDLSFELFSGDEPPAGLFDPISSAGLSAPNDFGDYDPTDYDPPHSGNSLMMYGDNDYMSPPLMPSPSPDHLHQGHHRSASVPFDYSSPSSNNDDGNDRHSRASSVSSAQRARHQAQYFQSPRLDVAHTFENMTVRSPSWAAQQLPQQHKAPTPPRLLMPDTFHVEGQEPPPTINAPDADNLDAGPQLHIVPATPIGRGVTGAPFQNAPDALNHGTELQPSWVPSGSSEASISRQSTPFRFPARGPGDSATFNSPVPSAPNSNANPPFIFPQQQRIRSKSGGTLELPTWDPAYVQQHGGLGLDIDASNSVDDTALGTGSSTTSVNGNGNNSASYQMHAFTFATGANYLSPDSHSQQFGLRRAKSENGQGRPGHRQSRSEDIRGLQQTGLQLPQQQQQQPQQQFLSHSNHGHSSSLSASQGQQLFLPPNDFMTSHPQNPNLLSTNLLSLPPIRSVSPGHGHIRRASSGSRAGRGIGAESWLAEYGNNAGSSRASPYPTPNASPRVRYDELELDLERENNLEIPQGVPSAGFENEVALSGRMTLNAAAKQQAQQHMLDIKGFLGPDGHIQPPQVSKPNVTTLRTANASHKRRKQEAAFVCPFPGCGSTFTRSFNLKGHIRSHNEEKPFVCHWPGCGKGFARQHDCKRHEQLHTNYRPFTCEGCNRQFARMDALNRHLRSEGGAECAKTQTTSDSSTPSAQSPGSRSDHYSESHEGSPVPGNAPAFSANAWVMQGSPTTVGVSL